MTLKDTLRNRQKIFKTVTRFTKAVYQCIMN